MRRATVGVEVLVAAVTAGVAACGKGGGARVEVPAAAIELVATAPGMSPAQADVTIAGPLTLAAAAVPGAVHVAARSDDDGRDTIVRVDIYLDGGDPLAAASEARAAVERVQAQLPDGVLPTVVVHRRGVIARAIVRGDGHLTPEDVRTWVDWELEQAALRTPGATDVEVCGGAAKEIVVRVDPARLAAARRAAAEVIAAIGAGNAAAPAGQLDAGGQGYTVRSYGALDSLDAIGDLPLGYADGAMTRVRDVASIEDHPRAEPCPPPASPDQVIADVRVLPDADAQRVVDALHAAEHAGPPGVRVQVVHAPARYAIAIVPPDAGASADQARQLADGWRRALGAAAGVAAEPAPPLRDEWTPDRQALARYGLDARAAATAIEVATGGAEAGELSERDRRFTVRVALAAGVEPGQLLVPAGDAMIPLSQVTTHTRAPSTRPARVDGQPAELVRFTVTTARDGGDGGDADAVAAAALAAARAAAPAPDGWRVLLWREP